MWEWDNLESDTVDILIVRSLPDRLEERKTIQFESQIGPARVLFSCAASVDVGFARYKKSQEAVQTMPEYNLGLEIVHNQQPA